MLAEVIAIDGKTVRRSYRKKGAQEPIHVVSAFAARQRMVLGRPGSATNPTRSSPSARSSFWPSRRGGGHRRHGLPARHRSENHRQEGRLPPRVEGEPGTLRDDVELFAREQEAVAFENASVSQDTTVEGDHGRIETRTTTVFHDIGGRDKNHQWPGLKSVVMVESERETDGKVETETRFYITSLALLANALDR